MGVVVLFTGACLFSYSETELYLETETDILRQATEFQYYPGMQAGKFLFSTGELGLSPRGLDSIRSASLQADLSLKIFSDPPARISAQDPRFFVVYESPWQCQLASSSFDRSYTEVGL